MAWLPCTLRQTSNSRCRDDIDASQLYIPLSYSHLLINFEYYSAPLVHSPLITLTMLSDIIPFLQRNFLLLLPFLIIVRFFYRRYASPLRQYPGPFLAGGTRLWKMWAVYKGQNQQIMIDIHKRYGPVVRTAPNELSFSSPAAAQSMFKSGKGFHKTDFYWVFPPPENPDIFTEIREDVHAQKKRYVATPYSMGSMNDYAPFVEDTERLLMAKLDTFADEGMMCDLGNWLHYFAFDVLGEVAFSRKFGFLQEGRDVDGCIKWIDDAQWYDGLVGQVPWLDFLFRRNPLMKLVPGLAPADALVTRIAKEEMKKKEQGMEKQAGRKNLLAQLFASHEMAPEKFGLGDVFAVAHGAM